MNKTVKIIVLAVLALALAVGFYFMSMAVKKDKNPTVFSVKKDDITSISWNKEGCREAELVPAGNGNWKCGDVIIKKVFINDMFEALNDVKTTQIIENVGDLNQYGLENPFLRVTVRTRNNEYKFNIGDANNITQTFYFTYGDDKNVYLLPEGSRLEYAFNYDIDAMIQNSK